MKKYLKRFLSLGVAAVLAAALAGCSDSLSEDGNGTAAEETAAVENSASYGKATASLFVPDYAALVGKAKASSSARAVAPQTAKVVLTYGSAGTEAGSFDLSSATKTDTTNASGVAGTAYTFSFTLPAGTYAAGDIVISLYDSSDALLSSGTNAAETTIETDKETTESVTLVPNASDSNNSGSLAAEEMKFVKVTVGTDSDVVLATSDSVSLFLFDSTGKLVNNTTYSAPLALTSNSATLTKGDAETDYYVGIYNESESDSVSYEVTVSGAAAETSYTVVYGKTTLKTLTESELETYKTTYGLTETTDYTVSDTTVTLTESGYKKVNLLVSATMPTGNWGVKSDSSDTINVATNVTANGDFNAAYMNYYCVNGAYSGMSYTSTPKAYVSIAAAAFADVSSTSVELVIQQAYSNSSSCNPQIAVSNGTKILALSSVLDSQSKNDISFYLNPSDLTTNGLMIFTVDNTASSSSWSFSGLAAYKSDTALDTTAPEAATGFTATAETEAAELSWTASKDATAYILSYKTVEEAAKTAVLASSATSKNVDSLTAGSEYTFTLTAVDVYGNISSEASASATPTANTKTWADVAAENFTWTTAKANTDNLSYSGTAGTWQNMIIDATSSYEWTTGTTSSAFRTHNSSYFKVNANKYIVLYIPMTKDGTITLTGDGNSSGFAVYGGALPAAIEDTDTTTTAITASSNVWTYNYKTSEGVSGSSISITSGSDTISGESDGTYAVITIVNTTNAAGNSYLKDIARTYTSE